MAKAVLLFDAVAWYDEDGVRHEADKYDRDGNLNEVDITPDKEFDRLAKIGAVAKAGSAAAETTGDETVEQLKDAYSLAELREIAAAEGVEGEFKSKADAAEAIAAHRAA